ncbi:3-oxoacyl-ACP synthase III family protein [Lutispora sp.]|uniref:3-oxoacyl-ACP synthase III family protein n=1 Tax=Lutispora sp. TaxID=2828727 RepID=UPI002B203E29|nr:3-oxoacyl-[acyl-carrier-protein] synthase III C-terminal domain-containing protein [Lutispora sp.]MEA4962241.1 3-oxoacyl-[acyl-carrier-protein] synthase III C-terminal domain-containing protein [Lutispora sp.]
MDMVGIISTGRYVPEEVEYTRNIAELEGLADKIISDMAIEKVHVAKKEEPSDMAIKAARIAIERAGISPGEINIVIYSSTTSDYLRWSDAARIAYDIDAVNAYAFRIEQFCCGGMAGIDFAYSKLKADLDTKTILVVSADKFEKPIINRWKSASANFYGDGASACILKRGRVIFEIKGTHALTDGSYSHLWKIPVGGLKSPITVEDVKENRFFSDSRKTAAEYLSDEKKRDELFTILGSNNKRVMLELLDRLDMQIKDLDSMVLYNIGKSIMKKIIDIVGIDEEKTSMYIAKDYGHMGPADIVFNLDKMLEDNKFKKGDRIMLFSAGAGFSWSSALIEYRG